MTDNGLIPKPSLQKIYEKFAMIYQILLKAAATGKVDDGIFSVFPAYDNEVGRWKIALAIVTPDDQIIPLATFLTQDDAAERLDPDIDSNFMEVVTDALTKDDRVTESLDAFDHELVMPVFKDGIEPFLSENR
jgi:hypothetical protein